jgi:hypothetical protein
MAEPNVQHHAEQLRVLHQYVTKIDCLMIPQAWTEWFKNKQFF